MRVLPVPTISRMAAIYWPRPCQGALWIFTIEEGLPSTKLDTGMVSCTPSRASRARWTTLETISPTRHNSLHQQMAALRARTRVLTLRDLIPSTTLWTTPPMCATKVSRQVRSNACGICGRLCEKENEDGDFAITEQDESIFHIVDIAGHHRRPGSTSI